MKHGSVTESPSPLAVAIEAQRADAIFLSQLSAHETHAASEILAAIRETTARCGGQVACEISCAAEYGAHPETAVARMAWAHELARTLPIAPPMRRSVRS